MRDDAADMVLLVYSTKNDRKRDVHSQKKGGSVSCVNLWDQLLRVSDLIPSYSHGTASLRITEISDSGTNPSPSGLTCGRWSDVFSGAKSGGSMAKPNLNIYMHI
jgi:hypothetical protein